jgi:hypothetical protein
MLLRMQITVSIIVAIRKQLDRQQKQTLFSYVFHPRPDPTYQTMAIVLTQPNPTQPVGRSEANSE